MRNSDEKTNIEQPTLFGEPLPALKSPKKLKIESKGVVISNQGDGQISSGIPQLVLPTRWEKLKDQIKDNNVSLRTIIRPIPQAMIVVKNIVEYLKTTRGCQILIIRADTGSGKTTFLNTLPHYMQDVKFNLQTIDLEPLDEEEFTKTLWKIQTSSSVINLIILEGKENPEDITDKYI